MATRLTALCRRKRYMRLHTTHYIKRETATCHLSGSDTGHKALCPVSPAPVWLRPSRRLRAAHAPANRLQSNLAVAPYRIRRTGLDLRRKHRWNRHGFCASGLAPFKSARNAVVRVSARLHVENVLRVCANWAREFVYHLRQRLHSPVTPFPGYTCSPGLVLEPNG